MGPPDEIYPEIGEVDVGPLLATRATRFVESLGGSVPWRLFGRIPHASSPGGTLGYLRDLVATRLLHRYRFPSKSPARERLVGGLPPRERVLFRLLCASERVKGSEVEAISGAAAVEQAIREKLLIVRGDQVLSSLLFVPYEDSYYLSDAAHVMRNATKYPFAPAFLGETTALEIATIRRLARRRSMSRMLEMGAGVGMATLELERDVRERVGAELNARSLGFANANREMRRDEGARFVRSDLFSEIDGNFDLILFNPWWPSLGSIDLIRRFLSEAPPHLSPDGVIVLGVCTAIEDGRDRLLDDVDRVLDEHGMSAERELALSYLARDEDGRRRAWAFSLLLLRRAASRRMRTRLSIARLDYLARRAAARVFP